MKICFIFIFTLLMTFFSGCGSQIEPDQNIDAPTTIIPPANLSQPSPSPEIPDLQAELLDGRDKISAHGLGTFDFKNYSYALPRGWENPDGSDIELVNGLVKPVEAGVSDDMSNEEKADLKATRRIGLSYVTTKYLDATGDGEHEAIVILKIETGGGAIPQVVYVYSWKDGGAELIWMFRTGDRADGGLKDIRVENGLVTVELYGQDRFILGQIETGKITGDEEQLCCPTHFTRSQYKWNGTSFLLNGKRLTYSNIDKTAPPIENLGDIVNAKEKDRK